MSVLDNPNHPGDAKPLSNFGLEYKQGARVLNAPSRYGYGKSLGNISDRLAEIAMDLDYASKSPSVTIDGLRRTCSYWAEVLEGLVGR